MSHRVFPSVTTYSSQKHISWRDKIEEVRTFGITEFALFLTGLNQEQRKECYSRLEQLCRDQQFCIPFVHATSEMHEDEYWYLRETYGTERFNLHPTRFYPLKYYLTEKLRGLLCIENSPPEHELQDSDFEGFGGACIDLSHLEEMKRLSFKGYVHNASILKTVNIAANHISGVRAVPVLDDKRVVYSTHWYESLEQFDYLSQLPLEFFSPLIAIELENSIEEQLAVVDKVRSLLNERLISLNVKQAA